MPAIRKTHRIQREAVRSDKFLESKKVLHCRITEMRTGGLWRVQWVNNQR